MTFSINSKKGKKKKRLREREREREKGEGREGEEGERAHCRSIMRRVIAMRAPLIKFHFASNREIIMTLMYSLSLARL